MTKTKTEAAEFVVITDNVEHSLREDHELAAAVAGHLEEMEEADRRYAMSLAALRQAMRLTQNELAERLDVTQGNVAQIERRPDVLLSTLRSYITAIGGDLRLLVSFGPSHTIEIEIPDVSRQPAGEHHTVTPAQTR